MRSVLVLAASAIILIAAHSAGSAQDTQGNIGHIKTVKGDASIVRDGSKQAASLGDQIFRQDRVETGADGMLGVTLNDNSLFSIGPNTKLAVEEFDYDSSTLKGDMLANMLQGTLAVKSGDIARGSPGKMRVKTPFAILGADGKVGEITVDDGKQKVTLNEAYSVAHINDRSRVLEPFTVEPQAVSATFREALAAQPVPPRDFILYFEHNSNQMKPESKQAFNQVFED